MYIISKDDKTGQNRTARNKTGRNKTEGMNETRRKKKKRKGDRMPRKVKYIIEEYVWRKQDSRRSGTGRGDFIILIRI